MIGQPFWQTLPIRCLLLFPGLAFATSVVGVRTPTAIVIGADSKVGRGDVPGVFADGCKIGITNKVAWGYAGILSVGGTDFSLEQGARRFMGHSGTFAERVTEFEVWVMEQLAGIIPRLKKGDPKYFSEHIDGRIFSEILFATSDDGILRMSKRKFVCYQGSDGKLSAVPEEFPSPEHPESAWTALGKNEAVGKAMKANPGLFEGGLERGIEHLIQLEIDTNTDVGPPISIVRVEKDSIRWIQTGACPQ